MHPLDTRLREDLATAADEAGPLTLSTDRVLGKVRWRRQRSMVARSFPAGSG